MQSLFKIVLIAAPAVALITLLVIFNFESIPTSIKRKKMINNLFKMICLNVTSVTRQTEKGIHKLDRIIRHYHANDGLQAGNDARMQELMAARTAMIVARQLICREPLPYDIEITGSGANIHEMHISR